MTGYGAAEVALGGEQQPGRGQIRAEVRSVNHRHLQCSVRLPRGWEQLESAVVERVRARFRRGRLSVSVSRTEPDGIAALECLELNMERARQYVSLMESAAAELGVSGQLDANTLVRLPGVIRSAPNQPTASGRAESRVLACIEEALRGVRGMRETEGRRLGAAIRKSLAQVAAEIEKIEARAPERLIRARDRLRARIQLLADSAEVDEDRLAREVAHLAERWDVAEEIVRLRSHAAFFLEAMEGNEGEGSRQAAPGKRLGFVVQEMNREANTLCAKANDSAIAASGMAIKEELERIREQLENVE